MKPTIWIRLADGELKEIPKRNWQAHRARGAIRIERAVVAASETADIKLEPAHIGGGYYVMPDGSRVRGREAAGLQST